MPPWGPDSSLKVSCLCSHPQPRTEGGVGFPGGAQRPSCPSGWVLGRVTRPQGTAEAIGPFPLGTGSHGGLKRQRPDQIASRRLSGASTRALAPGRPSRIVAGPLTVTAPSARGSGPSSGGLSGPPSLGAFLLPDSWP